MSSRKTIAIDASLVEELKKLVERKGSTLAGYLRRLFKLVIELEKRGIDPLRVLENAYVYEALITLSAVPIPAAILGCNDNDCIAESLREFAEGLKELDIDGLTILRLVSKALGVTWTGSRILVPTSMPASLLVKAIAEAYGYPLRTTGAYLVVEVASKKPGSLNPGS